MVARQRFELVAQKDVTVVPGAAHRSLINRADNCAVRFFRVSAIRESAFGNQRSKLWKTVREVSRINSPHANFAQARRIHYIAVVAEMVRMRTDGSMPPLVNRLAYLADAKIESRKHRIEE